MGQATDKAPRTRGGVIPPRPNTPVVLWEIVPSLRLSPIYCVKSSRRGCCKGCQDRGVMKERQRTMKRASTASARRPLWAAFSEAISGSMPGRPTSTNNFAAFRSCHARQACPTCSSHPSWILLQFVLLVHDREHVLRAADVAYVHT